MGNPNDDDLLEEPDELEDGLDEIEAELDRLELYEERAHHRPVWTSQTAKTVLVVLLSLFTLVVVATMIEEGTPRKPSGWIAYLLFLGAAFDGFRRTVTERWGRTNAFIRWAFVLFVAFIGIGVALSRLI